MTKYLCVVGISDDKTGARHEPGDVIDELPAQWMLDQGLVRHVEGSRSKSTGKKAQATKSAKEEGAEIRKAFKDATKALKDQRFGDAPEEAARQAAEGSES